MGKQSITAWQEKKLSDNDLNKRHLSGSLPLIHNCPMVSCVLAWEMELITPKDIRLYNKKKNACRFLNGRRWSGNATDFIEEPGSRLVSE